MRAASSCACAASWSERVCSKVSELMSASANKTLALSCPSWASSRFTREISTWARSSCSSRRARSCPWLTSMPSSTSNSTMGAEVRATMSTSFSASRMPLVSMKEEMLRRSTGMTSTGTAATPWGPAMPPPRPPGPPLPWPLVSSPLPSEQPAMPASSSAMPATTVALPLTRPSPPAARSGTDHPPGNRWWEESSTSGMSTWSTHRESPVRWAPTSLPGPPAARTTAA